MKNFYRTFALLTALKINLVSLKKANGQAFRSAEVQKSTREFSHGLNFRCILLCESNVPTRYSMGLIENKNLEEKDGQTHVRRSVSA